MVTIPAINLPTIATAQPLVPREKTRTLWQIADDLTALEDLLEEVEGDITGVEPTIVKWLDELGSERDEKLDNYCAYRQELRARAEDRREEAQRLLTLAKQDDRLAQSLTDRARDYMEAAGIKKIETRRYKMSVRNNGGVAPLKVRIAAEKLPNELRLIEYKADNKAIREKIKEGKLDPSIAELLPRGRSLVIK